MHDPQAASRAAVTLLQRHQAELAQMAGDSWPRFLPMLNAHLPALIQLYWSLYGERFDCYAFFIELLQSLARVSQQRPAYLQQEDAAVVNGELARHAASATDSIPDSGHPFAKKLGYACYVDLFAGDFQGLHAKIPYLQQQGIDYLHLMPLFKAPLADSDGGYAVSDYRQTDTRLGTMQELAALLQALHQAGISPVLDFVFNHTSDEHAWAQQAKAGDPVFQDYYYFLTASQRDAFAPNLREIFPQIRRGCFSEDAASGRFIWTTFNNFQWDLNYQNPAVFNAMAGEMLFLANQGASVLRLDALAFVWKEAGTSCENLPKAHQLIQCFNRVARIAAPALQFKSEAIVHPDEVVKYIAPTECPLSYNPLLMALLWEALATRQTQLLTESLKARFQIDPQCSWVNYIRCHDDIGWTFDDAVAWRLGINPSDHRRFLNDFYTGRFPGSFAAGVAFGENPATGDCRVAGMLASLAGVEQALKNQNSEHLTHALARIFLLNSVLFSIGGMPLIYQGDEWGLLNDHRYLHDQTKQHDSRWVNRLQIPRELTEPARVSFMPSSQPEFDYPLQIQQQLEKLRTARQALPLLNAACTEIAETGNPHLFYYRRVANEHCLHCLCNFSEHPQTLSLDALAGLGRFRDELNGVILGGLGQSTPLTLSPYQVLWLTAIK